MSYSLDRSQPNAGQGLTAGVTNNSQAVVREKISEKRQPHGKAYLQGSRFSIYRIDLGKKYTIEK